jgi:soluble lytic murein transglycosylase-like protein
MHAAPPASPALAAAVSAANWGEVRALTREPVARLSPVVALVAARAERALGRPARAFQLVERTLPNAGDLSAALRVEGAEAMVALRRDPWPLLAPLLSASSPPAHRRAAVNLLREAWTTLPLATLERGSADPLPRVLRRALWATTAVRSADEALALHVLGEHADDEASVRTARWLAERTDLAPTTRLTVAEVLLTGGEWRKAEELLRALDPPSDSRLKFKWAYLRGRAAYRLGALEEARAAFEQASSLANCAEERFTVAVQAARVAELRGDPATAAGFWDLARAAQPREVEGWDGAARLRVVLGEKHAALAVFAHCPSSVRRVVGPRLAALLLLRNDPAHAGVVLTRLHRNAPVVRALTVAHLVQTGRVEAARMATAALLADPRGGPWREHVLELLPPLSSRAQGAPPGASRDRRVLARIASQRGAAASRTVLARALASDPAWAPVLAGTVGTPDSWTGPAAELAAVGLRRDAAVLYPHAFPDGTPAELAWSVRTLATWGNRSAALTAGEQLWAKLGPLPAVLLPDATLPAILPPALTAGCSDAARRAGIPPSWLVAIARQESRFDADAYSPAGAIGIAQLVPETARRLGASPAELRDSTRSLSLAAHEVARLSARFDGRLAAVAASYNAGEKVVSAWLAESGNNANDVLFAAAVPYRETAGYILAVCEGTVLARYLK